MSITKTTDAEVYRIWKDHEWATIMLRCWSRMANVGTPHEGIYYCGEILIHSSYGAWANTWTACGSPFKRFLMKADFDYVFTKFMGTDLEVWDGEGSVKNLRRKLIEARQIGDLRREDARAFWDEIEGSESELESSQRDFFECCYRMRSDLCIDAVDDILSEPWELTTTQHDHQAVGFWRELWPEFTQALRAEVAADALPAAA